MRELREFRKAQVGTSVNASHTPLDKVRWEVIEKILEFYPVSTSDIAKIGAKHNADSNKCRLATEVMAPILAIASKTDQAHIVRADEVMGSYSLDNTAGGGWSEKVYYSRYLTIGRVLFHQRCVEMHDRDDKLADIGERSKSIQTAHDGQNGINVSEYDSPYDGVYVKKGLVQFIHVANLLRTPTDFEVTRVCTHLRSIALADCTNVRVPRQRARRKLPNFTDRLCMSSIEEQWELMPAHWKLAASIVIKNSHWPHDRGRDDQGAEGADVHSAYLFPIHGKPWSGNLDPSTITRRVYWYGVLLHAIHPEVVPPLHEILAKVLELSRLPNNHIAVFNLCGATASSAFVNDWVNLESELFSLMQRMGPVPSAAPLRFPISAVQDNTNFLVGSSHGPSSSLNMSNGMINLFRNLVGVDFTTHPRLPKSQADRAFFKISDSDPVWTSFIRFVARHCLTVAQEAQHTRVLRPHHSLREAFRTQQEGETPDGDVSLSKVEHVYCPISSKTFNAEAIKEFVDEIYTLTIATGRCNKVCVPTPPLCSVCIHIPFATHVHISPMQHMYTHPLYTVCTDIPAVAYVYISPLQYMYTYPLGNACTPIPSHPYPQTTPAAPSSSSLS